MFLNGIWGKTFRSEQILVVAPTGNSSEWPSCLSFQTDHGVYTLLGNRGYTGGLLTLRAIKSLSCIVEKCIYKVWSALPSPGTVTDVIEKIQNMDLTWSGEDHFSGRGRTRSGTTFGTSNFRNLCFTPTFSGRTWIFDTKLCIMVILLWETDWYGCRTPLLHRFWRRYLERFLEKHWFFTILTTFGHVAWHSGAITFSGGG